MGLLEEIQKQIAVALAKEQGATGRPEAEVAAKPEFQGGLADLITKGGLGGLLKKFEDKGLGDLAASWVGTGANKPVSPDQVHVAFGPAELGALAAKLGLQPGDISKVLAKVLPGLIDKMTPHGKIVEEAPPAAAGSSAAVSEF
jgi:uncharacterized protein YidB (DUF937 family)